MQDTTLPKVEAVNPNEPEWAPAFSAGLEVR